MYFYRPQKKMTGHGVIVENGNSLEIESGYLNFFEDVLNVNEEISVLSVQEGINTLKEQIGYFLQETNVNRKATYQNAVRQLLQKTGFRKTARIEAEPLSEDDLADHVQEISEINPDEVWNGFKASGYNLFDYILRYDYKTGRSIRDHASLFCQLLILHPDQCRMTGDYATYQDIEYPIIYAK